MFDSVKGIFGRRERPVATPPRVTRPEERVSIVNPYHAVSIKAGPRCCHAAASMAGVRFLSREAPRLPLYMEPTPGQGFVARGSGYTAVLAASGIEMRQGAQPFEEDVTFGILHVAWPSL